MKGVGRVELDGHGEGEDGGTLHGLCVVRVLLNDSPTASLKGLGSYYVALFSFPFLLGVLHTHSCSP